uniref:Helicase domain-containing protein n=1 Tax=Nannochloropsis gaditana (strain CCMP526) TaxID=1093141 RepID=I2CPT4_NANGC
MACLVEGWCPQDSMRQRRGRAGRVQPGKASASTS